MADIFVSYASDDRPRARRLASFLEDNGHTVWWDRALIVGGDFEQEIDQQLNSADVVIVCWSALSVASHWVKSEANEGMRSDRLVPVTLDKTPAPRPFDQLTTLDLSNWSDEAGKRLLAAIGEVPDKPSMSAFQKARLRTRVIAGGMTGCLALAIVGLWGPVTSLLTPQPANAVTAYEKPRLSEAAIRHILRRLNDTGRPTERAVSALIRTGDVHDAIRLLETKQIEMGPDTSKEEEVALLHQIGALAFDYNPAKAHGVYQSLRLLAADDPLALERSALLWLQRDNAPEAEKVLKRALDSTNLPLKHRLFLQVQMANLKLHLDEIDLAKEMLAETIAKAEANRFTFVKAKAIRHQVSWEVSQNNRGSPEDLSAINKVIKLQEGSDDTAELINSLIVRGVIHNLNGDIEDALIDQEAALELALDIAVPAQVNLLINNLATAALNSSDFEKAEHLYRRGIQYNFEHNGVQLQTMLWTGMARLADARGDPHHTVCDHLSKSGVTPDTKKISPSMQTVIADLECS